VRRHLWALMVALAILPSCTGSKTNEITALLAVAVNIPTGTEVAPLLRFYDTASLTPGSNAGTLARKVGEWPLTANDPIVATLFQRSTVSGGPDQIWVLTKGNLIRLSVAGLATNANPFPPVPPNAVNSPALGVDCSQGYLRQGVSSLLVVCPPPSPTSTALPTVWKVDLNNPTLDPSANPPLNLSALSTLTPLRFALDNQDRLVYLGGLGGLTIGIGTTRTTNDVFRDLTSLAGKPNPTAFPSDFIVQTNTANNTATAYGLYTDPTVTTAVTYLLTWDLSGTPAFVPTPDPTTSLSARFFAVGGPPLVLLGGPTVGNSTPATALARFADGAYRLPPPNVLDRNLQYSSAVLGLDQYLYAAVAGGSTLWVLDFSVPTENLAPNGRTSLFLDPTTNAPTVALAYVPLTQ